MSLISPQVEAKYEVLKELKLGGMGAIYKVRHRLLDEIRVIKVMRPHIRASDELGARFLREAKTATLLQHDNIGRILDYDVDEKGKAFIVMEFIEGLTFGELRYLYGRPEISLALELARQSLRALEFCHRHKYVHRDIAPDNLMVTRDAEGRLLVKLIDLGITKALEGDQLTQAGTFLGKVRYCSPEHFGDNTNLDARSDIYSFGVVLYEFLTGYCPIPGNSNSALVAGHLYSPPVSFEESDPEGRVPPELRKILLDALKKSPEKRIQSSRDFSRRLSKLKSRFPLSEETVRKVLKLLSAPSTPQSGRGSEGLSGVITLINSLIDARDFPGAETELGIAEQLYGPSERLQEAHRRLTESQAEQGAEKVREAVDTARSLIADGNYKQALRVLLEARFHNPEDQEVLSLIEEAEQAQQRHVRELLDKAKALAETGNYEKALTIIGQVLAIDPNNRTAESRREAIEAARKRRELEHLRAEAGEKIGRLIDEGSLEDARGLLNETIEKYGDGDPLPDLRRRLDRARALATALSEIDEALEGRCWDRAEKRLAQAMATLGEHSSLRERRSRLEELKRRDLERQASQLLEQARGHLEAKDFQKARSCLSEVEKIIRSPEIGVLRETIEREERGHFRARAGVEIAGRLDAGDLDGAESLLRKTIEKYGDGEPLPDLRRRLDRARELATALSEIDEALEGRSWDRAEKRLAQAMATLGEHSSLRERRSRLEELKLRDLERQASELLDQARGHLEAKDFQKARSCLSEAEKIFREHPEIGVLREMVEREEHGHFRARAGVEVAERLDAGDLDGAESLLRKTIEEHGDGDPLPALRRRLDRERELATTLAAIDEALRDHSWDQEEQMLGEAAKEFGEDPRLSDRTRRFRLDLEDQASELLKQADANLAADELQSAQDRSKRAIDVLAMARRMGRMNPQIRASIEAAKGLMNNIRSRQDDLRQIQTAVDLIEPLIASRKLGQAIQALDIALSRCGPVPVLLELRERIEELTQRSEDPTHLIEPTQPIDEPTDFIDQPTQPIGEPTQRIDEPTQRIEEPTQDIEEPTQSNKRPDFVEPNPVRLAEETPYTKAPVPTKPVKERPRRTLLAVTLVAATTFAVVLGALWSGSNSPEPTPNDPAIKTAGPPLPVDSPPLKEPPPPPPTPPPGEVSSVEEQASQHEPLHESVASANGPDVEQISKSTAPETPVDPALERQRQRSREIRQTEEEMRQTEEEIRRLADQGRIDEALRSLAQAKSRFGDTEPQLRSLQLFLERRQLEQEIENTLSQARRALEQKDVARVRLLANQVLEDQEDNTEARELLAKANEIQEEIDRARRIEVRTLRGEASKLAGQGDLEAAIQKLRKAYAMDPDDDRIRQLLAEIEGEVRMRSEIRATLQAYEQAFENLDAKALLKVMDYEEGERFARTFKDYDSLEMTINNCTIYLDQEAARVSCDVSQRITRINSRKLLESDRRTTFGMERQKGEWKIKGLEYN